MVYIFFIFREVEAHFRHLPSLSRFSRERQQQQQQSKNSKSGNNFSLAVPEIVYGSYDEAGAGVIVLMDLNDKGMKDKQCSKYY